MHSEFLAFVRAYLAVYNLASFAGWSYVLYLLAAQFNWAQLQNARTVSAVVDALNVSKSFQATFNILAVVQGAAVLEVLHALLGFVKTPVATTVIQVSSRLLLSWGIVKHFAHSSLVSGNPVYVAMVVAWSLTETVRYSYYAVSLIFQQAPGFLTWFRYTLFFVLYPLGAGSEAALIYAALPLLKARPVFVWIAYVILAFYPAGFFIMYSHMIKQRAKYLFPGSSAKSSSKKGPSTPKKAPASSRSRAVAAEAQVTDSPSSAVKRRRAAKKD